MLDIIIAHPIKASASLFIIIWCAGVGFAGNSKWYDRLMSVCIASGVLFLLTLIWFGHE